MTADLDTEALREALSVWLMDMVHGSEPITADGLIAGPFANVLADNARLHADNLALLKVVAEHAKARGEAEGRLRVSELAGVVEGWRERALMAEAKVEQRTAERNALAAFARDLFDDHGDRDALELQNLGIAHGLLREVAFDPEKHIADETSVVLDAGEPFVELTDLCAPIRSALAASEGASHADR